MNAENSPPVLVVVTDLIFSSRISAEARALGQTIVMCRKPDLLAAALQEGVASLLLLDLNCDGLDCIGVIRSVRAAANPPRIVAFFSHVQEELGARALQAGADRVIPRSRFVKELPELLRFAGRAGDFI